MITLAFLLDHQVISRSDKNTVVAGSKNYVRALLADGIREGVNGV